MYKWKEILFLSILLIIYSTLMVGAQYPEKRMCLFEGPYTTYDKKIKLSDYYINGTSQVFPGDKLYPGDKIKAGFEIRYLKSGYLSLDKKNGLFFRAKDPDGEIHNFGNSHKGKKIKKRERLNYKTEIALDMPGTWEIWPSLCYEVGNHTECVPDRLYPCYIHVSASSKDTDGDGFQDHKDNCPFRYNKGQEDVDEDGKGDKCDPCDDRDSDGDGIKNCIDKCPYKKEPLKSADRDGCPGTLKKQSSDGKCGDGICKFPENSNTCAYDCPISGNDGFCDNGTDGICDPDCGTTEDPDCENLETGYGVKFGGEIKFLSGQMSPGGIIDIPVVLATEHPIRRMALDLSYQPDVLQAESIFKGSLTANSIINSNLNNNGGTIDLVAFNDLGLDGEGSVVYIRFKVLGSAGEGSFLEIVNVTASNLDGAPLLMDKSRGVFIVETPENMKGDCNGDRKITAVDSLIALKMSKRLLPPDTIADMDNDGDITASDYLKILKLSLDEPGRL